MKRILLLTATLMFASATPALAAPSPSPVAPSHTGTACQNVIAHNPQAGPESHSAPQAQANFQELGSVFCF